MFKRIKFLLLYPRLLNNLRGKDVLISDIAKLVKLLDMNYFLFFRTRMNLFYRIPTNNPNVYRLLKKLDLFFEFCSEKNPVKNLNADKFLREVNLDDYLTDEKEVPISLQEATLSIVSKVNSIQLTTVQMSDKELAYYNRQGVYLIREVFNFLLLLNEIKEQTKNVRGRQKGSEARSNSKPRW